MKDGAACHNSTDVSLYYINRTLKNSCLHWRPN